MSPRLRWSAWALASVAIVAGVRSLTAETPSRTTESEARLRRDVTYLASDECEGRGVTTEGIRKAADYIAGEFRKAGLKPGGVDGTYFQPFSIPGAVQEAPATFSIRSPKGQVVSYKQGTDFYPMGMGHAGTVNGLPAVFAGLGISNESEPAYDDYDDLDVADKVVFVLRDVPEGLAGGEKQRKLSALASKISTAEKNHAAAIVFVNDANTAANGDNLLDFNFTALAATRADIPVLHAHRSVLEAMLPGGADELRKIETDIAKDHKPQSRELEGWTVSLSVKMKRDKIVLKNVIGVLEGAGALANETVVVGAHYDHLGYGGPFSTGSASLARLKKMAIHHGADDNGSGSTAVMELARRIAATPPKERRRIVFMTFSGEEINLLGSAHYAKFPIFPLEDTVAMVNLDMVGRLRRDDETKKDKLLIEGSGTAKTFDTLLEDINKHYNFKLSKKASGYGPSDHTSFYQKKVPVIFCWTGLHEDYHRPSDTADKIDVPGMRKVTDFAQEIIAHVATVEPRPEYVYLKSSMTSPGAVSVPRLGIRPSYDDSEDSGMLLDDVSPGGPAAKAGLKGGDRIVEVAGKAVRNLETYMTVMAGQKKTGTLEVVILRGGKRMPFKLQLD
jgi:Peptidase family M28/PDZ domain/PA domain